LPRSVAVEKAAPTKIKSGEQPFHELADVRRSEVGGSVVKPAQPCRSLVAYPLFVAGCASNETN
jgi:hypothetical protein